MTTNTDCNRTLDASKNATAGAYNTIIHSSGYFGMNNSKQVEIWILPQSVP